MYLIDFKDSSGRNGSEAEYEYDYMFFENSLMPEYYFYSAAKYSDGSYIKNINGKLPVCEEESFTAPNSLELKYGNGDGNWEASISFERIRGNDFHKGSNNLSFWIFPESTNVHLYPKIALSINKAIFAPYFISEFFIHVLN
ncbi:unnamed protein product [marine sediment metagenome]|uniref:Uncharacterized protein n=1 Tax=marine sediment metagenome TaxID=412755 RepID=X1MJX8_9ZZZZ